MALISFAVTAKLICVFVFAHAKSRFSHNEAHIIIMNTIMMLSCYDQGPAVQSIESLSRLLKGKLFQ